MVVWAWVLAWAGCLDGKLEPAPFYAEILPTEPLVLSARYDAADTLQVLGIATDGSGTLTWGMLDPAARALVWGPTISASWEGVAYDPYAVDTWGDADRFQLAPRPGTDEVWLFLDGMAGRLEDDGSVDLTLRLGDTEGTEGTLAFEDRDHVLMSASTVPGVDAYQRLTLDGAAEVAREPLFADAPSPTRDPYCSSDVGGGVLLAERCDNRVVLRIPLEGELPAPVLGESESSWRPASTGVAEGYGLGRQTSDAVCVGELLSDGNVLHEKIQPRGDCYGWDSWLAGAAGADVRSDGDQFVQFFGSGLFVVFDRRAPKGAGGSLEGAWCQGDRRFTLTKGEPPVFPVGSSDAGLYGRIRWTQAGDRLTVHYDDPLLGNDPTSVQHWALRVGDTLHMKSYTHSRYEQDGAGLTALAGPFVPCAAETAQRISR